ncbi:hypothetical protein ACFX1W_039461 [Malus domestica]
MNHLETLDLKAISEDEVLDLESISTPPEFLRTLFLKGRLEQLPSWISNLQQLVRLGIYWSRLRDSPLKALQNLPNLLELHLERMGYDGEQLHFEEGGFQKLRKLTLWDMEGINSLIIDNGVMPLRMTPTFRFGRMPDSNLIKKMGVSKLLALLCLFRCGVVFLAFSL